MNEPINSVLPQAAISESDFLKQQSELARTAMANALSGARAALAEGVDPREWTRRYPIIAIGSAAAAGFVAAVVAIPSKETPETHRFEKLYKWLHSKEKKAAEHPGNGKSAQQPSVWLTLLHEGINLIKPVLTSVLFSGLGGHSSVAPRAEDYGGSAAGPDMHDNAAGS